MWSQCLPYQGELDGGLVADSEFVVTGRDTTGLFQQTDPALDLVPALVHFTVEAGWPSTRRATPETVSCLVTLLRDGVRDLPAAQVLADLPGGVRAVGQHVVGTNARSSATGPWNADAVHDLGEHRSVAALSGGDDGGQDTEGGIDSEVNLGGQAATRASERMVRRLGRQPVGRRPARIVIPFLRAPAAC
jgi:hypothetical protein